MTDQYEQVATLDEIGDGRLVAVSLSGGERVALVRFGDEVFAVADCCSHAEFPISDSDVVEDYVVECALHGAQFDVRDGSVLEAPAVEPLETFDVKIENGAVLVRPRQAPA